MGLSLKNQVTQSDTELEQAQAALEPATHSLIALHLLTAAPFLTPPMLSEMIQNQNQRNNQKGE